MSLLKEKLELKIEQAEFEAQNKFSRLPAAARWAILLAILATIPAYYAARSISQNYWQGKYRQYAVTAKPSFTDPLDLEISPVTVLPMPDGSSSAVVSVTNQNPDLSLNHTAYHIDFYNSNNEVVYSYQDKLFLLPNQKKYLVVPKINVSEKIASFQLELPEELPWVKRLNLPQAKLVTNQPSTYLQIAPLAFVAEGNFQNSSPYGLGKVRLVLVGTDLAGKIVAVSQRDEFTVKPNERRSYKQLWPGLVLTDIAKVTVYADTDVLDASNLTLPDQPKGPASDLDRPEIDPYW